VSIDLRISKDKTYLVEYSAVVEAPNPSAGEFAVVVCSAAGLDSVPVAPSKNPYFATRPPSSLH